MKLGGKAEDEGKELRWRLISREDMGRGFEIKKQWGRNVKYNLWNKKIEMEEKQEDSRCKSKRKINKVKWRNEATGDEGGNLGRKDGQAEGRNEKLGWQRAYTVSERDLLVCQSFLDPTPSLGERGERGATLTLHYLCLVLLVQADAASIVSL